MKSIQGKALVASPYLADPNFLRSVVYILKHDEEGAIGVVLNRPMETTVGQLLSELTDAEPSNGDPVYYGGPVDGPLMLLQACRNESMWGDVVSVASDQERISSICSQPSDGESNCYRVFDGYSGWGPKQLEREIEEGGWLIWDVSPQVIFSECEELWHGAIREIGRDILSGGIGIERMPADPALN